MKTSPANLFDAALAALPGWMFLCAGLALLGAAMVIPPWLEVQDLRWRHDLMQAQSARLMEQKQRYADFHQALLDREPVLLERLAMTQLGYKDRDKQLLPIGLPGSDSASIGAWLEQPLPRVGVDLPPPRPINSRLVRLVTGQYRTLLLAVAGAWVVGGLWMGSGVSTPE